MCGGCVHRRNALLGLVVVFFSTSSTGCGESDFPTASERESERERVCTFPWALENGKAQALSFGKWTWAMSLENTFVPACVCHGGGGGITIRSPQRSSPNLTAICSHRIQNQWQSTHDTSHKLLLTAIFHWKANTPPATIASEFASGYGMRAALFADEAFFSQQFLSFLIAHILTTVTYIGPCRSVLVLLIQP